MSRSTNSQSASSVPLGTDTGAVNKSSYLSRSMNKSSVLESELLKKTKITPEDIMGFDRATESE